MLFDTSRNINSKFIFHIKDITIILFKKYKLIKSINPHEIYEIEQIDNTIKDLKKLSVKLREVLKEAQSLVRAKEDLKELTLEKVSHKLDHLRSISNVTESSNNWQTLTDEEREEIKLYCSIFHFLVEIFKSNNKQILIYNKYNELDFSNWVEEDYIFLYKSLVVEFKNYSSLIKAFDLYVKLSVDEIRLIKELIEPHEDVLRNSDVSNIAKTLEKDKETMDCAIKEAAARNFAKAAGVSILNSDNPDVVLSELGNYYRQIIGGNNYSIYWDTIPIIRKELYIVLEFIDSNYINAWNLYFGRFSNKIIKFMISGGTRSKDKQEDLFRTSPYAVEASKSMHVRGLAIDISFNTYIAEFKKQGVDLSNFNGEAGLKLNLKNMFDFILKDFKEVKHEGAPLVTSFLEPNGCYHISVCPMIDAIRTIRTIH